MKTELSNLLIMATGTDLASIANAPPHTTEANAITLSGMGSRFMPSRLMLGMYKNPAGHKVGAAPWFAPVVDGAVVT